MGIVPGVGDSQTSRIAASPRPWLSPGTPPRKPLQEISTSSTPPSFEAYADDGAAFKGRGARSTAACARDSS